MDVFGRFGTTSAVLPEDQILRQLNPTNKALRRMGVDTADDAAMRKFSTTTADDLLNISFRNGHASVVNTRLAAGTVPNVQISKEIAEQAVTRTATQQVALEALEKGRRKFLQDVWSKRWI